MKEGYTRANAIAKVCQDIILKEISKSPYFRNVTIKGGVVMHSISNDKRRATRDIDLAEINGLHSNVENFLQSFIGVSTKHLQGYLDWFSYQKYLTYTVELLKQPQVMMNYVVGQMTSINIADIYSKEFPIDIYGAYSEYHFTPSPDI